LQSQRAFGVILAY